MKKYSKLKARERDLRKNLILQSAEKLYESAPYDQISMKDLAQEVGFSPGSLYTYFPSQESLFGELVVVQYHRTAEFLSELFEENNPTISEISEKYIDLMMDKYEILRIIQNFMVNRHFESEELSGKIDAAEDELLGAIDPVMNRYVPYDKVRPYSETFLSTLNGIILSYSRSASLDHEQKKTKMKQVALIACELFDSKLR